MPHRDITIDPNVNDRRTASAARISIGFVLAPNFTMLPFSGFVDTLRLAADEDDRSRPIHCAWSVVSPDLKPIRASCGIDVVPTARLAAPDEYDYLVVVGGLLHGQRLGRELQDYLRAAARARVPIVAVCTGSFILAELGLMDGRKCCVSWFHHAEFQRRFPHLQASSEEMFVIDRDRLSCAGGVAALHLAAYIVALHRGRGNARKALRIMIERPPMPPVTPQPQPDLGALAEDSRVRRAMLLIERNLDSPLSIEFVANYVGLSKRHLERLFKQATGMGPTEFALRLRLANAHQLLTTGNAPISDVALQCGFTSHSHFASSFRTAYGKTPSWYRARRAAGAEAQARET